MWTYYTCSYIYQTYRIRGIFYAAFNLTLHKSVNLKTPTILCVCIYTHLMF